MFHNRPHTGPVCGHTACSACSLVLLMLMLLLLSLLRLFGECCWRLRVLFLGHVANVM